MSERGSVLRDARPRKPDIEKENPVLNVRAALAALFLVSSWAWNGAVLAQSDPLPSWNDGKAKTAIVEFVRRVTREGGPDFVKPAARIATFDNDGTLWAEQPVYVQVAFALDRVKALAPQHRDWRQRQ